MTTFKKIETGTITSPTGFKVAGLHAGIKHERNDLGAIFSDVPASAAAVYTLNKVQAAPLGVTKESIAQEGKIQAVVVNSGNANACTGEQGKADAREMRQLLASHLSVPKHYVAVASTGVIGNVLPMDKITTGIKNLKPEATNEAAEQFSNAILTTDTFAKSTCYEATIGGETITIAGNAKGSGMIEPNMATMLSFITTDVAITPAALQTALSIVTNKTFNCITVDGDTSTNDMVLVMANGLAKNEELTEEHTDFPLFTSLLKQVAEDLAKMIARDGEGATKLIEVEVQNANNEKEAIQVAKSVVGSSLVKTAVYGADANWGRILAAVGYSGVDVNPDTIDTSIGSIQMLKDGQPISFSEEEATAYLQEDTIHITIDLKSGNSIGKAWGCDLTYDYVRINASYRS